MIIPHRPLACAALLLLALAAPAAPQAPAQEDERLVSYSYEGVIRGIATAKVLPEYPEEAVKQGISGVFEVYFARDEDGKVVRVRVPAKYSPLVKKPLATAVKAWRFQPHLKYPCPPGTTHVARLTLNFVIEEGHGRVELYDPPRGSHDHTRLLTVVSRQEWLSMAGPRSAIQPLEDLTDDN